MDVSGSRYIHNPISVEVKIGVVTSFQQKDDDFGVYRAGLISSALERLLCPIFLGNWKP